MNVAVTLHVELDAAGARRVLFVILRAFARWLFSGCPRGATFTLVVPGQLASAAVEDDAPVPGSPLVQ